jgi:hypothetical protein
MHVRHVVSQKVVPNKNMMVIGPINPIDFNIIAKSAHKNPEKHSLMSPSIVRT